VFIIIASIATACAGNLGNLLGQVLQTRNDESTVSMSSVTHIQVCNKSGNTVIHTDPSVEKITVKSRKAIYTDNDAEQAAVDRSLQALVVHIQDASSSNCSWLSQGGDSSTLTVTATTPDDQDIGKVHRDRVDLEIIVPDTTIKQSGVAVHIESFDQIQLTGIGGNLQLTSLSGNVDVEKSFLGQDSRLYTASGDLHFSGALHGPTNNYEFISDSGDVTLTFPTKTNATLEMDAPTGSISSDFNLKNIEETATGARFSGELNPGAGIAASIKLKVRAGDGSITIHKS